MCHKRREILFAPELLSDPRECLRCVELWERMFFFFGGGGLVSSVNSETELRGPH